MTRRFLSLALTAVLVAAVSSPLFALDTVTRKSDNKKFGGTIIDMSKNEFKVKKPVGEPDVFQANDVSAVDWDGASGDLRLGVSDENGGRFEMAIQRYTKSQAESKGSS